MKIGEDKPLCGMRIGIFGKGGSGKSTVAVLLTQALRDHGYHVCLLDADSTNVGLAQSLGFPQAPVPLLDYFGGMVFSGGSVTCPVDDPVPLKEANIDLDKLPPKYHVEKNGITLLLAGKIGDKGPGAGCDGPVAKIARDVRIQLEEEPLVTLVDFKAGFEDSARGAITGLDWVIVVIDPTIAAIEMASDMKAMVARMKALEPPATMHLESPELVALANRIFVEANIRDVLFILNKVRDTETEEYLRDKLAKKDIEVLGVIREDPALSTAWLKGNTLVAEKEQSNLRMMIEKLEKMEERT